MQAIEKGQAESKTSQRDPQAFDDLVKITLEEAGAPETVYINPQPIQDMFEGGHLTSEDINDTLRAAGIRPEDYNASLENLTPLAMPTENLATMLRTQGGHLVKGSVSFQPVAPTIDAAEAKLLADLLESGRLSAPEQRQRLGAALEEAGRPAGQAERIARIVDAFSGLWAERYGADPTDYPLWKRLKIVRDDRDLTVGEVTTELAQAAAMRRSGAGSLQEFYDTVGAEKDKPEFFDLGQTPARAVAVLGSVYNLQGASPRMILGEDYLLKNKTHHPDITAQDVEEAGGILDGYDSVHLLPVRKGGRSVVFAKTVDGQVEAVIGRYSRKRGGYFQVRSVFRDNEARFGSWLADQKAEEVDVHSDGAALNEGPSLAAPDGPDAVPAAHPLPDISVAEADGENNTALQEIEPDSDDHLFQAMSLEDLDPIESRVVEESLDADLRQRLETHKGTPWEKQTVASLLARRALDDLVEGREPGFASTFTAPSAQRLAQAIKDGGPEAVWNYLAREGRAISHPSKPVNSVSSSYTNCNPSAECAKFCYAVRGNNYPSVINKGEMMSWAIEQDPTRAAKMVAGQYKIMPEFEAGKALRMLDRGEMGPGWVEFLAELEAQGVRAQVFSKRPDLLQEVSDHHLRLLSTDSSNLEVAEANPDLGIAFVYRGQEDVAWLDGQRARFKEHGGVILPVKIGNKILSEEELQALPVWAKPHCCPVDTGLKKIGEWNCTKCDRKGGIGCFHGQVTAKLQAKLEKPLHERDLTDIIEEARARIGRLDPDARAAAAERLALLLSEIRSGIDPGAEGTVVSGAASGTAESQEPDVSFQTASSEVFYSQLARLVEEKLPNKGTGNTYLHTLMSWANKGQFKAEEWEWSGLREWLTEVDTQKIDKEDVVAFLHANSLEIEEVHKEDDDVWSDGDGGIEINSVDSGDGQTWFVYDNGDNTYGPFESYNDADEYASSLAHDHGSVGTRYSHYTEPGGADYREVLLTLPGIDGSFYEQAHWAERNVVAHLRLIDRADSDGRQVLHIEEVQSDWHQKGRREGYRKGDVSIEGWEALPAEFQSSDSPFPVWVVYDANGRGIWQGQVDPCKVF